MAAVQAKAPPDRLLVFEVKDGWEPLCHFLGVAVPDEDFPHANDAATLRPLLLAARVAGWALMAAIALAVVWALW